MKHSSSAVRKFICRWVGILLLLLPFIGVPKSWKDSVIFIFAILLIFASFSVRKREHVTTTIDEDEVSTNDEYEDEESEEDAEDEFEYGQDQRPL